MANYVSIFPDGETVDALLSYTSTLSALLHISESRIAVGTTIHNGKFKIATGRDETINSLDIYHFSDQANASNATISFALHDYTDGYGMVLDKVGENNILTIRQARNPTNRSDKADDYVGTGNFIQFQRSTTTGTGGNLGNGNDIITSIDAKGNLLMYRDWDSTVANAPIRIGTYTHYLNRSLYMGYSDANNQSVIGSLDLAVSAWTPILINASIIKIPYSSVSVGASVPNASSILDLTSTEKGFLPPRMTTEQRDAISSPAEGLQIYNTTTHKINFYNGTAWETVTSAVV